MTNFQIKRLPYNLTAHAGLSLMGQSLKRFAQINQVIDPRFPINGTGGIASSSLIKAYIVLLCTGKSDFGEIESLRQDAFLWDALDLASVPSSPTLRQHMDTLAASGDAVLTALDDANERLLRCAKPTLTPLSTGHLALDFDVFTLNNSGTTREGVERTYMGFDGYAPIFASLAAARESEPLDWLVKWNPRTFDKAVLHQRLAADPATVWTQPREGKRETFQVETVTRGQAEAAVTMRRVIHLTERTIDRHGQILLMLDIELEGWLTSLDLPVAQIVKLYQGHGTHEQFHSEFKTDLDLECLPSGKFATNDLVLSLAMLAFNILRAIGQSTLISPDSPVRHTAKLRRIKTVMQAIIGIAARVIQHARRITLGLGERCAAFAVFERHHQALLRFTG